MVGEGGHRLVVVDAMNVIGAGAGGWWRDRPGAQRRLHRRLVAVAANSPADAMVVYEGSQLDDLPEGDLEGVAVRWARRRGPDAADDRIVEEVAAALGPVVVVTSDRALRARVEALGATAVGPGRLDAVAGTGA